MLPLPHWLPPAASWTRLSAREFFTRTTLQTASPRSPRRLTRCKVSSSTELMNVAGTPGCRPRPVKRRFRYWNRSCVSASVVRICRRPKWRASQAATTKAAMPLAADRSRDHRDGVLHGIDGVPRLSLDLRVRFSRHLDRPDKSLRRPAADLALRLL